MPTQRLKSITTVSDQFQRASRSLVWGALVTAFAGFLAALPLLASVFAPWAAGKLRAKVSGWILPTPRTRLSAERDEEAKELLGALGMPFRS